MNSILWKQDLKPIQCSCSVLKESVDFFFSHWLLSSRWKFYLYVFKCDLNTWWYLWWLNIKKIQLKCYCYLYDPLGLAYPTIRKYFTRQRKIPTPNYFSMLSGWWSQGKFFYFIILKKFSLKVFPVTPNKLSCEWKRYSWLPWLCPHLFCPVLLFTESEGRHAVWLTSEIIKHLL